MHHLNVQNCEADQPPDLNIGSVNWASLPLEIRQHIVHEMINAALDDLGNGTFERPLMMYFDLKELGRISSTFGRDDCHVPLTQMKKELSIQKAETSKKYPLAASSVGQNDFDGVFCRSIVYDRSPDEPSNGFRETSVLWKQWHEVEKLLNMLEDQIASR
ncbi:MAG: hypothetical protein ACRYGR_10745 [Janthinobacterium lividum]